MIFVVDNYDSFTYNLVQYLGELGAEVRVTRNDACDIESIARLNPTHILISPGPCTPDKAGVSCEIASAFSGKVPLLGVCLGHQCIGQVFGGKIVRAQNLMHGKTSPIHHNQSGIFKDIPTPFDATRYHSLIIEQDSLPEEIKITAWTDQREIMGIQHTSLPVYGVQFHPESILTQHGKILLANFLALT